MSCRLPRKPSLLLRSRLGGSGGRRGGFCELPATAETLLASPEPFPRPRGGVEAAFERCRLLRKPFRGKPSRFSGAVSAAPRGIETALETAKTLLAFPGPLRRLLRVAGYLGNPSCFSGAVSAAPGVVESAFERCRLPRKRFSFLRSRFGCPGRRLGGFRELPATFSLELFFRPLTESAFERCRLPRKTF